MDANELPPCVITLSDKGLFGSTGMGQVTIKTQKKLTGTKESEGWYPLQPSKSGKATSGATQGEIEACETLLVFNQLWWQRCLKGKRAVFYIWHLLPIFLVLSTKTTGLAWDEFLEKATPDQVNLQEAKTQNAPLHIACLQCKSIDERILRVLVEVRTQNSSFLPFNSELVLFFCLLFGCVSIFARSVCFISRGFFVSFFFFGWLFSFVVGFWGLPSFPSSTTKSKLNVLNVDQNTPLYYFLR